jgi:N-methylhydantoinase A
MLFQRFIDMRYLGQWRSMAVPVSAPIRSLEEAMATFHEEHGREHNYKRTDAPVEVYRLTVSATGLTPKAQFAKYPLQSDAKAVPFGYRDVKFDEDPQPLRTPLYNRDDLVAGTKLTGPAIIDQLDSTTVVPPGVTAEVDAWLTIVLRISPEA